MAGRTIKLVDNSTGAISKEVEEMKRDAERLASDGFKELQKSAPQHLSSIARYEYERVSEELRKLPIRNLDRATLEMYCTWYGIYRDADERTETGSSRNGYGRK